jgi:hypothetical protein
MVLSSMSHSKLLGILYHLDLTTMQHWRTRPDALIAAYYSQLEYSACTQ